MTKNTPFFKPRFLNLSSRHIKNVNLSFYNHSSEHQIYQQKKT
jgi:hypothetical protein